MCDARDVAVSADVEEFEAQRPRLFAMAYRMLGSASEAEDAVQDAYLRWHTADRSAIETPAAWLAKVLTNLCVNRLTSARARREAYVGPWLPEPVLTGGGAGELGPLETAEQRESVSLAVLVLLERLTPAERAVFVLREAFGYAHAEVAEILEVSEAASRKLHSRARARVEEGRPRRRASQERAREVARSIIAAASGAGMEALEGLLAEDIVVVADGGGEVTAARRPVVGRERVRRFLGGLLRMSEEQGYRLWPEPLEVNGESAVLVLRDGEPFGVFAVEAGEQGATALRNMVNPGKIAFFVEQWRSRIADRAR